MTKANNNANNSWIQEIAKEIGVSGLQEIFKKVSGSKERVLYIMAELTELFGAPSPWPGDYVIVPIDYTRRIFIVADMDEKIIVRAYASKRDKSLKYKEIIAIAVPTRVVVYEDPAGGFSRYEITFDGRTLTKPLHIGPTFFNEVVNRLIAEGLVTRRRLIYDALAAVVNGFIRSGKAELKELPRA
ncbi:MAG: hypothetical protein QXS16_05100 [Pyrobaculum sp.]